MDEMIESMKIFRKYCKNHPYPFSSSHDVLHCRGARVVDVTSADKARLEELGWMPGDTSCDEYDDEAEEFILDKDCDTWHLYT